MGSMRFAAYLLCCSALVAQSDVRKATWGMTPDQVRTLEQGTPETGGSTTRLLLRYATDEFLPHTTLNYTFQAGKLSGATYVFAASHEDEFGEYIADYHAVTKPLLAAHGAPTCEHVVWIDDSLQNERMPYLLQDRALPNTLLPSDPHIGEALSLGHFRMFMAWDTPRAQILHILSGAEGSVHHTIELHPPGTYPLETLMQPCKP
jgi:hypothetical protein